MAEQLRVLAASIEIGWRYRVARPAVEGCEARFSFRCPREWAGMEPTDRSDVRHCHTCAKPVYYCATVAQARDHAVRGDCVAVDVIPPRKPGDLAPSRGLMMGRIAIPPSWKV
jgi:hypothetical protein